MRLSSDSQWFALMQAKKPASSYRKRYIGECQTKRKNSRVLLTFVVSDLRDYGVPLF